METTQKSTLPPVPPLPAPRLTQPRPGVSLLQPLSRRGVGPGLILLVPQLQRPVLTIENGVPSPLIKWAEEGYVVVALDTAALQDQDQAKDLFLYAAKLISDSECCEPKNCIGLIAYDAPSWNLAAPVLDQIPGLRAAGLYATVGESTQICRTSIPTVQHLAGKSHVTLARQADFIAYDYPTVATAAFSIPFHTGFDYNAEAISHTRNLTFLKKRMDGPYFDLEQIWEEHTYYEFENRSVEHTMSTMVQEPYVNHIPTLTGGIGRAELTAFYRDHFIWKNPEGTELELISRTMGIDRVVDEFIFKFQHNTEVDWLIPGIAPTHRHLEIPFMAVVNIRGDRLYHEHITWDQGTVLAQLGLLPDGQPSLDDSTGGPRPSVTRLPVLGQETCQKLRDKNSVASNQLFANLIS